MKQYLISLLFALTFTVCPGQQKIEVQKNTFDIQYMVGGKKLGFKSLERLIKDNAEAYEIFKKGKNHYDYFLLTSIIGGGMLGWNLGRMIARVEPDYITFPLGVLISCVSIPLYFKFNKHFIHATDIYNKSLSHYPHKKTELKFAFHSKGFGLRFSF